MSGDDFNEDDIDYDSEDDLELEEFEDDVEGGGDDSARSYNAFGSPGILDAGLAVAWIVGSNVDSDENANQIAVAYDYFDRVRGWMRSHEGDDLDDGRQRDSINRERDLNRNLERYSRDVKSMSADANARMNAIRESAGRDYTSLGDAEEGRRLPRRKGESESEYRRRTGRFLTEAEKRIARREVIKKVAKTVARRVIR